MPRPLSNWRHLLPALSLPYVLVLGGHAFGAPEHVKGTPFTFHDMNILGTSLDLQVTAATEQEANKVHASCLAEIERLRKILSTYDPNTDISKVNGSMAPVKVAPEVIDVLKQYENWQSKSKGAYSGGMGELIATWKKAEKDGKAPDAATLSASIAKLKKPLWKIDETAKTVQRLVDVPLNIDSLGKGYIINQAALFARKENSQIRGLLLNVGGDIVALGGCTLSGPFTPWTIGITDPALPAENAPAIIEVRLSAGTVATSGSYARNYAIGDKKYSHIIDPRTGEPVDFRETENSENVLVDSATVVAPDNATANALASTLCVLPPAEGLALVRSIPEANCLLILSDGSHQQTAGFKRYEVPGAVAKTATPAAPVTPAAKPADPVAAGKPATPAPTVTAGAIPAGSQVDIALQINAMASASNPRPYLAVWIETDQGAYVKTVAVWGTHRNYFAGLHAWWKQVQSNANATSKSSATRQPGKYSFTWDGTDDNGQTVPKGTYKVCVDTAFWRGGQASTSGKITCGDQKSTGVAPGNAHLQNVLLTYAPKGS